MVTTRGLERVPVEYRDLFYYEKGKLRARCKECTNTRSTKGMSTMLLLIQMGGFTGFCRQCELKNLAKVSVLTPEEVEGMNVKFDFDSQRREKGHIVIDKVCTECDERVTVRSATVKMTLRRGGTPQGKCVSCGQPGWYLSSTGYIQVRMPEHPNAVNGYVPEHRLVMEKELGRYLTSTETVHHIDGNRVNNSYENLQLRQGNHGAGVKYQCLDCGGHNVKTVPLD